MPAPTTATSASVAITATILARTGRECRAASPGPRRWSAARRPLILRPGVHSRARIEAMPTDSALTALALPIADFPAIAREAEARGYRTAWIGEASGAEAIVLSTLVATHTRTIAIANGVIPVQTRTPVVYGQA